MGISSSGKRTAVALSTRLFNAVLVASACAITPARAQDLFDSIRAAAAEQPAGYVFVSDRVTDTALIPLARDARAAGFTIVVNGFWGDLAATRQRVARINEACCGKNGAHWQVNPLLFQRYQVTAVPSFVLAVGPGNAPTDFAKVTGEMSVANALKTFAQQSRLPPVRRAAAVAYKRAFATQ